MLGASAERLLCVGGKKEAKQSIKPMWRFILLGCIRSKSGILGIGYKFNALKQTLIGLATFI